MDGLMERLSINVCSEITLLVMFQSKCLVILVILQCFVLILAVLYRVGVNTSIVLLWRNSIKVGVNWHKIQEIEHTPELVNASELWIITKFNSCIEKVSVHCVFSDVRSI